VGRKTAFERSPSPTELKLEPHRRQIEDFVWAVREDRDLAVTGEDARETLRLALAAYASAREGRAILMEGR
jgi:predicted dehydrogenase